MGVLPGRGLMDEDDDNVDGDDKLETENVELIRLRQCNNELYKENKNLHSKLGEEIIVPKIYYHIKATKNY